MIKKRRIDYFLNIPHEIFIEIFSFTSNEEIVFIIPLVCKRFKAILEYSFENSIIIRNCENCYKSYLSDLKRFKEQKRTKRRLL